MSRIIPSGLLLPEKISYQQVAKWILSLSDKHAKEAIIQVQEAFSASVYSELPVGQETVGFLSNKTQIWGHKEEVMSTFWKNIHKNILSYTKESSRNPFNNISDFGYTKETTITPEIIFLELFAYARHVGTIYPGVCVRCRRVRYINLETLGLQPRQEPRFISIEPPTTPSPTLLGILRQREGSIAISQEIRFLHCVGCIEGEQRCLKCKKTLFPEYFTPRELETWFLLSFCKKCGSSLLGNIQPPTIGRAALFTHSSRLGHRKN